MKTLTLIYSQRVSEIWETPIGFDPKTQKEFESVQENRTRLSVDQPCAWSTSRLTGTNREQPCASWSTALVDRFLATVDRAVPVHVVHTGRPGDRPGSVLACCKLCSCSFWFLISALFLPMSLKNSSDVFLSPLISSLPTKNKRVIAVKKFNENAWADPKHFVVRSLFLSQLILWFFKCFVLF